MRWIFFFLISFALAAEETSDCLALAQKKQALEQYDEAIELCLQCLEKNNASEERWLSCYTMGECFEALRRWDKALYWYLEAFQFNPERGEPLKKLSSYYRKKGWNELSYLFAKFGSRLPPSINPDSPLKNYQFDEDLSIVAYYTPFKEEGYAAASSLLLRRNVPYYIRMQTYQNILFYIEPLKGADYIPISFDRPFNWNPMNPALKKTAAGYEVICRVVNYVQKGAKDFQTDDEEGIFRSRNFLLEYDPNFHLISQQEILEDRPRARIGASLVRGLEDCRVFEWQENSWFTCTTTDTNPTGPYQISLCKLERDSTNSYAPVESLLPLKGPDPNRYEKNWLPFIHNKKLLLIYSYDPFVIYTPHLKTGDCESVYRYQPEHDFSNFRGSAGPIPFEGGYLVLVHEVVYLSNSERVYLHRFLYLNSDFKVCQASKPFIYKQKGVEFCTSMCWDHAENRIVMGLGIEDHQAWFCFLDKTIIRSLLTPLPL